MPVTKSKFSRRQRLITPDFAAVLRIGKLIRGNGVSLLLRQNNLDQPRLGLVVPKRIVRLAVDRNRLKRIFREWFRQNRRQLDGKDCVVRLSVTKGSRSPVVEDRVLVVELDRLISAKGL